MTTTPTFFEQSDILSLATVALTSANSSATNAQGSATASASSAMASAASAAQAAASASAAAASAAQGGGGGGGTAGVTQFNGRNGNVSLTGADVTTAIGTGATAATTFGLATVAASGSYSDLSNKPAAYALPTATTTVKGGVKADGTSITVAPDGTLSANTSGGVTLAVAGTDAVPVAPGTAAVGTSSKAAREDHVHPLPTNFPLANLAQGGATVGQVPAWNGTVYAPTTVTGGSGSYTLPVATTTVLGGVKVDGTTIVADVNGVLSVSGKDESQIPAASAAAVTDQYVVRQADTVDRSVTGTQVVNMVLTTGGKFTKPVGVSFATLTDAATVTTDGIANPGNVFKVTLGGNRTFSTPTNLPAGAYTYLLTQDATGSRTATWWAGAVWLGTSGAAPTLSTAAAKTDAVSMLWDGTTAYLTFAKGS